METMAKTRSEPTAPGWGTAAASGSIRERSGKPPGRRSLPALVPLPVLALACLLSTPPAEAAGTSPEAAPEIVATWQGGSLQKAEYESWLVAKDLEAGPESLRELVYVRALAAMAEARLGPEDAEEIRLAVEARRHRVLTKALQEHVRGSVEIREEEVESLRREHPGAFVRPRKLFLRNLFKRTGEDPEGVAAEMAGIRRRLLAGEDFEELARQESESQSRFRGGLLGFVDPEELPPEVAKAVRNLEPGQLSEPVASGGGLTIFLCEKVRPGQVPSPEEVRAKLRKNLERRRAAEAWEAERTQLVEGIMLDLQAVPHLASGDPPAPDRAVLSMPGYRMGPGEVAAVAALEAPDQPFESLSADRVEDLLRAWAFGVAAARRAVELGLDEAGGTAEILAVQRMEVLARRELIRRVDERLEEPTEEDLRRWYDAHPALWQRLRESEVAVIHFGTAAGDGPAEEGARRLALATEVVARIEAGDLSFEEAARRHSLHGSAAQGGYLGWRDAGGLLDWGPILTGALRTLEPGETTGLLRLESGLWIFHLLDRRPARVRPFEEVRQAVYEGWRKRRIQEIQLSLRPEVLREIGATFSALENAATEAALLPETGPPAAEPVVLRWSTASEFERYGYHVYRGREEDGPFERLTGEAIPGAGTTDLPQDYRFEDPDVEPGEKYFYYVESVSTGGQRDRLTPIQAIEARPRKDAGP